MSRHWTLDELTDHFYGIREADDHLAACKECSERLRQLRLRWAASSLAPEITPVQLATQRAAVLDRAVFPPTRLLRWIPVASAAAALLAVAVFIHRPAAIASKQGETTAISDSQLFADIYNIEESAEPLAAAPIHALFEDQGASQ